MSRKRAFIFRMITLVSLSLLAWTASAAPLTPGDASHGKNPLALTMTGSASRPQIDGTRIEWVITVANNGTEVLTGIVLIDMLPDGLALNRVDFERGQTTLLIDRQTITMTIARLEPGAKTEIRL